MEKYPVIDICGTGQRIKQIMQWRGFTVRDVQMYLGFATPQSIYHWFCGRNLPTTDNLYALSELFQMPMDELICGNRKVRFYPEIHRAYKRLYIYYDKLRRLHAG